MTTACTRCGRVWIVSIRTSPVGYVCPDCDLRQRYIAAGVIVPAEADGKEVVITDTNLVHAPITSILDYKAALKKVSLSDLQNGAVDLQIKEQSIKVRLKEIRREIQRRQKGE